MSKALIGYDTESGCVVEASYEPLRTLEKSIDALIKLHVEMEVPATFFVVGKTLKMGRNVLRKLSDHKDLFDIQQHTYSHQPLKSINPKSEIASVTNDYNVVGAPLSKIRSEVRKTNDLLKDLLDVECLGIRGPWGYYEGLSNRPDILGILHDNGIRFTSTYLRNKEDFFPVPMKIQPYRYEDEGFPDMLEIPSQDWIDCVWRTVYGWGRKKAYSSHLAKVVGQVSRKKNIVWGTCFHDWSVIGYDSDLSIMRSFFESARERKVELTSYGNYYKEDRPAG